LEDQVSRIRWLKKASKKKAERRRVLRALFFNETIDGKTDRKEVIR